MADITPVHVTEVIKNIDDDELLLFLPQSIDWNMFNLPTQSFPSWVYKSGSNAMSHFGLMIDLLLRVQLYCSHPELCNITSCTEEEQIISLEALSDGGKHGWKKAIPAIIRATGTDISDDVEAWSLFSKLHRDFMFFFGELSSENQDKVHFGMELVQGYIQGHPDIVWNYGPSESGSSESGGPSENGPSESGSGESDGPSESGGPSYSVVDIKSVMKPSTNCVAHMAQVCSYAALLLSQGKKVDYIGIYYPLQKSPVVLMELDPQWDHKPLLDYLNSKAISMSGLQASGLQVSGLQAFGLQANDLFIAEYMNNLKLCLSGSTALDLNSFTNRAIFNILPPEVGSHIPGCSGLYDSLCQYNRFPVQAFLTGRTGTFPTYDIPKLKAKIAENGQPAFSHLPYYINLCKPQTSKYPDPMESIYHGVIREMKVAADIGMSGCVVHVGKYIKALNFIYDEAFDKAKYYTLWILCNITPSCPLLLETPAGQGTETLTHVDDFIAFYQEVIADYPDYYKQVYKKDPEDECPFALCIDTCHVYSSGQKISEYITRIVDKLGVEVIRLIHYNDSKTPFGSKVDRHERICQGHIPPEELYWVYQFAVKNNIPMVTE